jgi:hypothetical protein
MAKLRITPEVLVARMLPGVDARLVAIWNDEGDVVLEIEGAGVPETDGARLARFSGERPTYFSFRKVGARLLP